MLWENSSLAVAVAAVAAAAAAVVAAVARGGRDGEELDIPPTAVEPGAKGERGCG